MSGPQALPLLRVSSERAGDSVVVRLEGELDCATAPTLDNALNEVLASSPPPRCVYVDADRLSFVDVSGLGPLLNAAKRLPAGSHLQLRNARRQVVRVVRLLDLADELGLDR